MEEDGRGVLRRGGRLIGVVLQSGGDGLVGAGIEQKGRGRRPRRRALPHNASPARESGWRSETIVRNHDHWK